MDCSRIKVIGFDADDTLWHNENLFRKAENVLAAKLAPWADKSRVSRLVYDRQMANLPLYGYGIKSFTIALVETAIEASHGVITATELQEIIELGKKMLREPVHLLDGVEEVLSGLAPLFKLVIVTKGDLIDQERKLRISNLSHYFHHIEIMGDKKEDNYLNLLSHLDIRPYEFLMVGNSLRSDILPVLKIGGAAVHIPYSTTWAHEHAEVPNHDFFVQASSLSKLYCLLKNKGLDEKNVRVVKQ